MRKNLYATKAVIALLFVSFFANAQPLAYQPLVTTGLTEPMDIAIPPNAIPANGSTRIYIPQRNGLIRVWNGTAFSDLVNLGPLLSTGGERGLLSMTFSPDFDGNANRDFYVYYTNTSGNLTVARYRLAANDPFTIDPTGTAVVITPIDHSLRDNHNGGDLNFGPDGFLYLTTGDGGGGGDPDENAQNPAVLLGKLLRIDVSAAFPVSPVVVGLGLRNPFRWSFDKLTGDAWIGDVGQGAWEEITRMPAGTNSINFGWDCYEGNATYEITGDCPAAGAITFPSYVYPNPAQGQSVVGGYVYRGTEFPSLQGWYVATDYFSGRLIRRSPAGVWTSQLNPSVTTVVSFGEAPDGTIYAVNQNNDDLLKLIVTGALPVVLSNFSGKRNGSLSEIKWSTATEQRTARFRVEYSPTTSNFQTAGTVTASRNASGSSYSFQHQISSNRDLYYRLVMEEDDGSLSYSSILRLASEKSGSRIYPSLVRDNVLNIQTERPAKKLQILGAGGTVVFEKNLAGLTGTSAVTIPRLVKGVYVAQLILDGEVKREKIVIE